MPTETEELKLRITLDDGATAQLQRVRQEMSQMAGGQTGQGLQNITSKATEAEKAFGSLARQGLAVGQTTQNFAKVLGPLPVTLGVIAFEFVRQLAGMKEWAGQMVAINNAARSAGINIGAFKGIQSQLRESGMSAQDAAGMMTSLTRTLAEASRPGSAVREGLIRMAGPQFAGAMMQSINKLHEMRDATDRVNYIRQMGLNVYANNFNRTHDEMQARYAQYTYLQQFGAENLINVKKDIAHLDQTTLDNMAAEADAQDRLNAALVKEEETRNRIWDIVKGSLASYEEGAAGVIGKIESWMLKNAEAQAKYNREHPEWTWRTPTVPGVTPALPMPSPKTPDINTSPLYPQSNARPYATGGIVTQPTMGLVGEAGPEAIIPLSQLSGVATNEIKHTESVGENTKQLKMLNDQMEQILNPSMISKYASGMGGAGPGGDGGGGASGYGPGGTQGAAPGVPNIPGTAGGPAIDMSSARMGLNPMWDDPTVGSAANRPGTWGAAAAAGGTESHAGAPASSWPAEAIGGGLATAAGGGNVTAGAGGKVDPNALFESYVSHFKGSKLDGFVPKDGPQFGISKGSPEEWARLAIATSKQESGLDANARGGGLNQFEAADLRRYGVKGNVNDPNAQVEALSNQWIGAIPRDGVITGPGGGKRWGGASAYFGSIRAGWNARGGGIDIMKHMAWAGGIAASEAGTTPTTTTGVAPAARFAGYGPFGTAAAAEPAATGGGVKPEILAKATEIARTGNQGAVKQFLNGQGIPVDDKDCGEFVGAVVKASGGKLPDKYQAGAGWLNYGQEIARAQAKPGDVLSSKVYTYGPNKGQPIPPGAIGGHAAMIGPGGYDPKTNTFDVIQADPLHEYRAPMSTYAVRGVRDVDAAAPPPKSAWPDVADDTRGTLDRMMAKETSHDVDTSGTITIKHDQKAAAPPPSKLPPFKDVPTNRQATMLPAHDGPQAPNPASGV